MTSPISLWIVLMPQSLAFWPSPSCLAGCDHIQTRSHSPSSGPPLNHILEFCHNTVEV